MTETTTTKYKGRKPNYLPVCDGVCDGYIKNRCAKCKRAMARWSSKGDRGVSSYKEASFSDVDIIRANPHLAWSDKQLKKAGLI